MATNDRQRQFDEIVARLTADYPSLAGGRRRPRHLLIALAVLGGVAWALLSVAMVAWGTPGVILTIAAVAVTALTIAVDAYRHRDR